jgi:hypothetical protein
MRRPARRRSCRGPRPISGLSPHLHLLALDGAWREQGGELRWQGLGHLQTSEVGEGDPAGERLRCEPAADRPNPSTEEPDAVVPHVRISGGRVA